MSGEASANYRSKYYELQLASGVDLYVEPPPGAAKGYVEDYFEQENGGLHRRLARAAPAITRLVDQAARTLPLAALPESCLPRDLRAVDLADDDHNSAVFSDYATTPPVTEDDIRAAMRDPANADGTEVDRLLRRLRNEQVLGEWAARIPRLVVFKARIRGSYMSSRLELTLALAQPIPRAAATALLDAVTNELAHESDDEASTESPGAQTLVIIDPVTLIEGPFKLVTAEWQWVDIAHASLFRGWQEIHARDFAAATRVAIARLASQPSKEFRLVAYDPSLEGKLGLWRRLFSRWSRHLVTVSLYNFPAFGELAVAVDGSPDKALAALRSALGQLIESPFDRHDY